MSDITITLRLFARAKDLAGAESITLNLPATVDLNCSVAVRAVGENQSTPTEIVLSNSTRKGRTIRFSTNRTYLARAVELGFRQLQVVGQDIPVCCRDEHRVYVWAVLGKDGIIPPNQKSDSSFLTSRNAVFIHNHPRQENFRHGNQRSPRTG